jgi:hypothetical protein
MVEVVYLVVEDLTAELVVVTGTSEDSVSVTGQTVVVTGMVTTVVVFPPLGQSGTSGAHEVMVRVLVV